MSEAIRKSEPGIKAPQSNSSNSLGGQSHPSKETIVLPKFGYMVQPRLEIGEVNDPLEREADRIADQVMLSSAYATMGGMPIRVQRLAGGDSASSRQSVPPSVERTLAGGGRSFEPAVRHDMEQRFGHDFSGVRVHTDSDANASARDINARAYTAGLHIVFASDKYSPGTQDGQRLLAHELVHTIQQGNQAHLHRSSAAPQMIQRDGLDIPIKEAKEEDAVDPLIGGVKEMVSKAADTPQLKNFALDAARNLALPIWDRASTGDKAAIIASGVATVGTYMGAMLSDPTGREILSGLPIGAPLSLVPYAVFSGFSYDLPKTKSDPLLLHLSFKGDDFLDLLHEKYPHIPEMTLSFDMTLSVNPDGKVTMPFGFVKFSPLPGVTLGGGYGVVTDLPDLIAPPGRGSLTPYKALPTPPLAAPRAGAAGFIMLDFTKIDMLRKIFTSF